MEREARLYPPFRALRRALFVSELHHLTRAADELGRSQPAITHSIAELENFLGAQLFERTATGMADTRKGAVLFRRVRAALDHLAQIDGETRERMSSRYARRRETVHFLDLNMSNSCYFLFLALCDHRDIHKAAASLGVATSTVRKSITELEHQFDTQLFEKVPRGMVAPTRFGQRLATQTKRALSEIRAGLDELRSLDGHISGQVRVGVMSTARSFFVPRAVDRLHKRHPNVLVTIYWGNYDDMRLALSCGDIDLIVGTLRTEEVTSKANATSILLKDTIVVVGRTGHPLSDRNDVPLGELMSLDWILPPPYFPLRLRFRELLRQMHLHEPKPFIETASLAIVRGILLEGNCVALSTRLQCWHDIVEYGLLSVVPASDFRQLPFHLHVATRSGALLSPAAQALLKILREFATQLNERLKSEWADDLP